VFLRVGGFVIGVSMMHPQRLLLVRWVRFSRQLIEMSFSSVACCFFESDRLFAEIARLNNSCYVSCEVRSQIEETLLLPITEIENRKLR